jgi:hypothetical protein
MVLGFKKTVIIKIKDTRFCIQWMKYLIKISWEIICVVSNDKVVIDWIKNNFMPVLSVAQLNNIKETNFYLFGITDVNGGQNPRKYGAVF